ncbi:MAG TPA: YCF48-related protein [Terracidiphilus sp.]|nr:YCF48-related protein [Terracidiphilus sp.]
MFIRSLSCLASVFVAALGVCSAGAQDHARQVWEMQESGTAAGLRGIDSVDGKVAWASGSEGTVLKTIDGGAHWQRCAVPDAAADGATLDFRGVQAWDAETAIVMASGPGEKSRLYKTTDGGKSWALILKNPDAPDGFFDSFWMKPNPNWHDGIVLGDPVRGRFVIIETADGGSSWRLDTRHGLRIKAKPIAAFAASNSLIPQFPMGFMRGFVTGGPGGPFLFYRWDEKDWKRSAIPVSGGRESSGAFSLGYCFTRPRCADCEHPSEQYMVVVGGDYTQSNEGSATAAWSTDVGEHWTASTKPPHGYRSAVQWSEALKAWITAGTNGSDISRDDGRTWEPLDDGNWNALSLPFVVGPRGRIARLNADAVPPAHK